MFATVGAVALIVLIYVRPQEFWEPLRDAPLLYIFFGLSIFGIALDVRLRNARLFATPQLPWVLSFYVWALITSLVRTPRLVHLHALALGISLVLFLVIAQGAQSFRALGIISVALLAAVLCVAGIGIHQGFSPYGCVLVDETATGDQTGGKPDGRPCVTPRECYLGDAEPGGQYLCERVGLAGTTSISNGRVRYRGVLQDPNELALAACVGLPLAFIVTRRRAIGTRFGFSLLTVAIVIVTTVLTASRGGQLVFLSVLFAYFVRRFGAKGLAAGFVLSLPVLALGGRSTLEASTSATERLACWYEAISMWRSHPVLGVGFAQFGEYHYLTAHNSYLLSLSELGLPGLFLFTGMILVSLRIPWTALRRYSSVSCLADEKSSAMVRAWAMGLLAACAGLTVGIFFLSFTYHYVLWIYFGVVGAFHGAVRRHDPGFHVQLRARDVALILIADSTFIAFMYVATRAVG